MSADKHRFSFTGKFGEVFFLILKNTIFTIFTLGLYIPYARTNMRKYIWKSTKLAGHPFLFHADPKNLLKGYLLLGLIAAVSFAVVGIGGAMFPLFAPAFALIPGLLIFGFALRARYSAYAYLVNNTSYRSIRFQAKRSAVWEFIRSSLAGAFFSVITLGFYLPFAIANLHRIKWKNTSYGNIPFQFRMKNWDFALQCYKNIFLTTITLGIYLPWAMASIHKFKMKHLSFKGAKIESTVTGGGLIWLSVKSSFFLVFSLGLAAPYILNMNLAYHLDHLIVKGQLDFEGIIQAASQGADHSFSDSVADALDLDVDVA